MSKIISMREYVRDKITLAPAKPEADAGEPYINDSQVWSKDYSKPENVIFGVLKIREVLNYYFYYDDLWSYLLLNVLDAVAHSTRDDHTELAEAAAHLRNYMFQAVDGGNRKNLQAAMLILDLIEKAPGFRAQVLGLPQEKAAD